MDIRNIKRGFDAARKFDKVKNVAAQYADDAFRAAANADALRYEPNAADAAEFFKGRAQFMDDFMSAYGVRRPVYASKGQQVGRAIAGVTDVAGNVISNPYAQMALFSAPTLLPSGGGEEQLTPEQAAYLQQQQMTQRGGYG
jgi:hypothetical protein